MAVEDFHANTLGSPVPGREDERLRVGDWRLGQLLEAGYSVIDASALAARGDIDLHVAVDLIAHGCPAETATKILL